MLLPDTEPLTEVLYHHIEKEEVTHNTREENEEEAIDDFVPFALGLIERTHSPFPEIVDIREY